MKRNTPEQFWSNVDKDSSPHGCWLWTKMKGHKGHGRVKYEGVMQMAHRKAWELTNGPVPDGLCVLHDCPGGDNPSCCNPDHLWLGTKTDNAKDRDNKGRTAHQKGSKHGMSKLTESDVREIRRRRSKGETLTAIAADYGTIFQNISLIVNRKAWTHID